MARATRSASRKARVTEAVATGPLGALSHDELGVIFDGLADPLQPVVAVALSSTCLGLRTPLLAALEVLEQRHEKAMALCRNMGMSRATLCCATTIRWGGRGLTADDLTTLGMILHENGLPRLEELYVHMNEFGDAGMHALCEGLGAGSAPSLQVFAVSWNKLGPVGAEALAAALRRGAMPKLETLYLDANPIGKQGLAALAPPLRRMSALNYLSLGNCEIGDEGATSLLANLGKEDFKALARLDIEQNSLADKGFDSLLSALNGPAMPKLGVLTVYPFDCSDATVAALQLAAAHREIALAEEPEEPFEESEDEELD